MNNKGFTLIELLATLIVLSIISVIVFSNVSGIVKEKKSDIDEYQEKIMKEAAESYIADYINAGKQGNCSSTAVQYIDPISISSLVNQGYLDDEYDNYSEYSVKVTCQSKENNYVYNYELQK